MMARGYITAPRPNDIIYAPIDLAVSICEQLAQRGHQMTYFGPAGSHLKAEVETLNLPPLVSDQQSFSELIHDTDAMVHGMPLLREQYYALEMFRRAQKGEFDLLHFHHPEAALPYAKLFPDVPVVYTLHDPIDDWYKAAFEMNLSPNQHFISISDNQRRGAPDLPYVDTVYNGTDTEKFALHKEKNGYLLFTGRVTTEKGIKEAVELARETDHRLLIIGPTYNDNGAAFERYVKPHLDDKILSLGFLEQEQVIPYYQKAKALLMPIQWEEPFGLTMIEAMSCGTPVLAMNRGSVPEIVKEGKTGFITDSVTEMAEASEKIDKIKPEDCRKHVEENFSVTKMADGYETAYRKVLGEGKSPQKASAGPFKKAFDRMKRSSSSLYR